MARDADPNLVINTLLRRIRFYLDEPENDKYSDNDLLDLVVAPALQEVWGFLNNTSDNNIVASFNITLADGTSEYKLPPSVQNVWWLARLNDDGDIVEELKPRSKFDRNAPVWYIEGDYLRFDRLNTRNEDFTVFYTPCPDQPMHYATDGFLYADLKTIKLSDSPDVGFADRRLHGYVGAIVRVIGSESIETRIISGHTPNTEEPQESSSSQTSDIPESNIITVRHAFTEFSKGTITYEIFPIGSQAFTEAVALAAVLKLGAARSISQARYKLFMDQYRQARRTEAQRLENMMARRGKHVDKNTGDNPEIGFQNLWAGWWSG